MTDAVREQLRKLTMQDNFVWLRSFGCRIERTGGLIFVRHDEMPEYTTWLFMEPGAVPAQIERVARRGAVIYADDELVTPDLAVIFSRATPIARNETVAVRVPRVLSEPPVTARRAEPSEAAAWSAVYSEGFGRGGADAEADVRRWTRSFRSPDVDHWFFDSGSRCLGVCQTTRGAVPGLYSFTLLAANRGVVHTRAAVRALLRALSLPAGSLIYYETLTRSRRARPRGISRHLLRSMTGYRFSREE